MNDAVMWNKAQVIHLKGSSTDKWIYNTLDIYTNVVYIYISYIQCILYTLYMHAYIYIHIYILYTYYKYIYTMEYYSDIKKNDIMPFAATWVDLEIIILSKSERERHVINYI